MDYERPLNDAERAYLQSISRRTRLAGVWFFGSAALSCLAFVIWAIWSRSGGDWVAHLGGITLTIFCVVLTSRAHYLYRLGLSAKKELGDGKVVGFREESGLRELDVALSTDSELYDSGEPSDLVEISHATGRVLEKDGATHLVWESWQPRLISEAPAMPAVGTSRKLTDDEKEELARHLPKRGHARRIGLASSAVIFFFCAYMVSIKQSSLFLWIGWPVAFLGLVFASYGTDHERLLGYAIGNDIEDGYVRVEEHPLGVVEVLPNSSWAWRVNDYPAYWRRTKV